MNIQTAVILAIVAVAGFLALRVRRKRGGCKCGAGKDCCNCPGCGTCSDKH